MAGHSHSANIKWRKGRQDSVRSQLFIKVRRKIEILLREEGKISEKSLNIARENKFPKEKVYQIWEKISQEKKLTLPSCSLYQAPFGIIIYVEGQMEKEVVKQLKLKELPLNLLANYFQLVYSLKVSLKEKNNHLEEHLLAVLPLEIWEKADYNSEKQMLFATEKKVINSIKEIIKQSPSIIIKEEKNFWRALVSQSLSNSEQKDYYFQLQKKMENIQFYTNVEQII